MVNALLSQLFLECVAGLNDRKECIFTNDMKLTRQNMKYFVHIVCNEIQVKVNLEITTFFFICDFHTVPTFSDLGLYQWCSRGHTQVYAVCLLFSLGCLRITTSKDQYLRIPSVYPLVLLLRKSVIYCSFPYNGVQYSCVKLVILCCNWCIITSVILPFPAHHRLSARVRCIERTPSTQSVPVLCPH